MPAYICRTLIKSPLCDLESASTSAGDDKLKIQLHLLPLNSSSSNEMNIRESTSDKIH